MADAIIPGYKGQLFYGTAGTTAATQVTNCIDLEYETDPVPGETTVRGTGSAVPIETERVTKIRARITWGMRHKPADTTLAALLAAARTGAAVAIRTKSYSSGTGFDGDCIVKVTNGMPLDGMSIYNFEARPTDDEGRTPSLNA